MRISDWSSTCALPIWGTFAPKGTCTRSPPVCGHALWPLSGRGVKKKPSIQEGFPYPDTQLQLLAAELPGEVQVVRTADRVVPVEVVVRVVDVAEVARRHLVGQVVHGQRNTGVVGDPVPHRGVVAPGGGQVRLDFRQVVLVPVDRKSVV